MQIYPDGSTYNGQWADNRKHGYGEEKLVNNCVYVGDFRFGNKHGSGKLVWENGKEYEGTFVNNALDG
jgi:1-phosphatidylinositol-4-phosphate 5-kinase